MVMSQKILALYHADKNYTKSLIKQFTDQLPTHKTVAWEEGMTADYLLSWKPDEKIFATRGVKAIFALGAGIDAFLVANIDKNIPLVRLEEAGMGAQMLEVSLYGILHYARDMIFLNEGKKIKEWRGRSTPKRIPFSTPIGVMGLGKLGGYVASHLAQIGYSVCGYSRSLKNIDGVQCFDECGFDKFLSQSEVLINLMPLTEQTENILNKDLFNKLPQGAFLINIARGRHLVEEDLTQALDSGQLSGALLDVFRVEPLPKEHQFWEDERIILLPHLAAITLQPAAARQISENIIAFESGKEMTGVVDRERGY